MQILAGKSRLIVAALGCVLAAGYAWAASLLRMPAFSDPMGPRTVPYLIAVGLVLSCVALVVEHVVQSAKQTKADPAEAGDGLTRVAIVAVGLLLAYYLVFNWLGFIVSTTLFLLAFLSFTNRGRWVTNIAVAVAFPIAVYLLLDTLLGARLPDGILSAG